MPAMMQMVPVIVEVSTLERPPHWSPVAPIDPIEMGYWLRQARRFAGNKTQQAVATQAREKFGAKGVSASSISAWEKGEYLPSKDGFDVLVALYNPPGGPDWFASAYCPDLRAALGLQLLPNVTDPWPRS